MSLHINIYADNITLIYIDLSDRPDLERVEEIVKEIKEQIVSSNTTCEFIVFITNGLEKPIVTDDINKVKELLNETPTVIDHNKDIRELNEIIYKESCNLKKNNVSFNFLLTPSNRAKTFINRFLLTNGLINRDGLISNIEVNIYPFGDKETEEYKSNCKIFKEKKYEINY